MQKDKRFCLLCKPKNRTIYFHQDPDTKNFWLFCNKCDRGYSLQQYCHLAGIELSDFLQGDFEFEDSATNEVQALNWPSGFVPLSDPRAEEGVKYIESRGLSTDGDLYYDMEERGIVFPYYFGQYFVGAQIRFLEPRVNDDGSEWKVTTLPGSKLGLLFGMWNQSNFLTDIRGVVVCEGYFNALSLQQAFNLRYGGVANNPWKFICTSGAGVSEHQAQALKDLRERGLKVICAFDTDEAGFKGFNKMKQKECVTHYAFTGDSEKDWNDMLKEVGHKDLASLFLSCINKI